MAVVCTIVIILTGHLSVRVKKVLDWIKMGEVALVYKKLIGKTL